MIGPRLPDLTPAGVARAACEAVAAHWARLLGRLGPALPPDPNAALAALERESLPAATLLASDVGRALARRAWGRGWRAATELDTEALGAGSDLGLTLQDLTRYAQTGDWGDDDGARDASQAVHEALYRAPGLSAAATPTEHDLDDEATTPWGVVLLAAHARHRLATGAPVRARELAALAGCSAAHVRHLLPRATRGTALRSRGRASTLSPAAAAHVLAALATDAPPPDARVGVYGCGAGRRWLKS